jgi:hypothetical protein
MNIDIKMPFLFGIIILLTILLVQYLAKVNDIRAMNHVFDNKAVYIENILPDHIYQFILEETSKLQLEDELNTMAPGRQQVQLSDDNIVSQLIRSSSMINILRNIIKKTVIPADYPVEYRKYPTGSYMKWHQDQLMYESRQYECVLILTNTSDSVTEYIDTTNCKQRGSMSKCGKLVKIHQKPNSLMIVRANGVNHQVTKSTVGEKTILKFIMIDPFHKLHIDPFYKLHKIKSYN